MYRIGVDIGGTFTDFALFDARGGKMAVHKRLTTPHDPSEAVTEGVKALLAARARRHRRRQRRRARHDARHQRRDRAPRRGHRHAGDGRLQRHPRYGLRAPLRPVRPARQVSAAAGAAPAAPRGAGARALRRQHRAAARRGGGAEAAAQQFRSWTSPPSPSASCIPTPIPRTRRARPRSCARRRRTSSSPPRPTCFPNMREFERWTTTTVNAFTQPMFDRYLERLEKGLAAQGFRGRLYIMASSGGTLTADTARRFPVRALESGPAAGALMSAYHGRSLDLPNLLSFDMGGTTAKGALVRGGAPIKRYSMEVARVHEFRQGSGLPIRIPAIDMIEIGAGGGSIAEIDERGLLRVGPRSAGADPGPACYGRGGTKPTLTDANLVLGYLDAGFFLGGAMALDRVGGRDGDPRRRRQAARARDAARGLGHPRHRQRGRGARLPHPRQRARLRLSLRQHGGVRRLGAAACAGHRPQAQDPARDLPGRRRRHVGARPADQPARVRDGALAAHPCRRHRCRRFRGDVPGAGGRGDVVPAAAPAWPRPTSASSGGSTCATRARATRSR